MKKPLDLTKAKETLAKFREENPELFKEPVRCNRCGRELTDEESVKMGFGPECAQKAFEEGLEAYAEQLGVG